MSKGIVGISSIKQRVVRNDRESPFEVTRPSEGSEFDAVDNYDKNGERNPLSKEVIDKRPVKPWEQKVIESTWYSKYGHSVESYDVSNFDISYTFHGEYVIVTIWMGDGYVLNGLHHSGWEDFNREFVQKGAIQDAVRSIPVRVGVDEYA